MDCFLRGATPKRLKTIYETELFSLKNIMTVNKQR
jgi:hypothetical protein